MTRRLSTKKLAVEFLRRKLAFYMSGMTGYKHGHVLNAENCPRTTDVEVMELVRTKQAKITRTNFWGRTELVDRSNSRRYPGLPTNRTVLRLTSPVPPIVDVTCPGCGEPFAQKHFKEDTWFAHHHSSWHAYDCPLRNDHYLDRYRERSHEIRQRKRGRKARPHQR